MKQMTLSGLTEHETVAGVVDSVIFASDDGGFAVFRLKPDKSNRRLTVTVNGAPPFVGQQVSLFGNYVVHPRFGEQFKAARMMIEAPADREAIEEFLASGIIDGLGAAMAHRIVAKFGDKTLEVLDKTPGRLKEVRGIGQKTAAKIIASYENTREAREVMMWLEGHGISGVFAGRIMEKYGPLALEILNHHPYQLARDIKGIGFLTADSVAASLGIQKDDEERLAAGLSHVLYQEAVTSGHCCLPRPMLVNVAAKVLTIDEEALYDTLDDEIRRNRLFCENLSEMLVYSPPLHIAECKVAAKLLELKEKAVALRLYDTDELVDGWERKNGLHLADKQREALLFALTQGVFILTGGPGTGKTTVVKGMIDLLEEQGLTIMLAAPTGRAAKRLGEATGHSAVTVHRLLEAQGVRANGESIFARNEKSPLEADALIIDEVSMMDVSLMSHFLAAVTNGVHIILVGDTDQLPSVGPGTVLKDMLRSRMFPSVCLTDVFRQSEESSIILNAHAINAGRMPKCVDGSEFEFREIEAPEDVTEKIVSLCAEELPAVGYSPLRDIQVLSPMHRSECGVTKLNQRLQEALNPPDEDKPEVKIGANLFRLGDKVMQLKNNYNKDVFNGDIGFIVALEKEKMIVRYADEDVEYQRTEYAELTLAYAMSVHKSQGSEYPVIVMPMVEGHYIMLQRNLLYTAVTRAKERVILLGSKKALYTAVVNDRTRRRYTLLAERLCREI